MSLASEILARRMRLPRARTRDVICRRDLPATMDDGPVLLADRWVARDSEDHPQPTVLVRSPYGRRQIVGLLFGRLLAERGFQVVIQSVRGTFGSGGSFAPFDERPDGLATLRWLRSQPWHAERIGMIGPSYLGLVQWAVAADAGDDLAALAIGVSASQFHGQTYAGGSLSLETIGSWLAIVSAQESRLGPIAIGRTLRRLSSMIADLPLADLDQRAIGAEVPWFRQGFASPLREGPYWTTRDFSAGVTRVRAPVQFVGGWYDILLPWMLEDFTVLQAAGRHPQLLIGPWTHTAPGLVAAGHRDGIAWLRSHLLGDDRLRRRAPVRLLVTGERSGGGWRDFSSWPPAASTERHLWIGPNRSLVNDAPPGGGEEDYRYDPADPTPSIGGPVLLTREAVLDNRGLEARPDVLTFDTQPLAETQEAIGPVWAALWIRADSEYFDLFARVCDVDPQGVSLNICDALVSVAPGEFAGAAGASRVESAAMATPELILHALAPSHPCLAAAAALQYKDLSYERVDLVPGSHVEEMQRIYGEGHGTVPGLLVDGEPVHGSRAIMARLEQLAPDPSLFPAPIADAVREAERWGDEELQDLGRRLPWGALHFRPEAMGTFGGSGLLDGPGTDFAISYVHSSWRYHGITAARLHDDLAGLPVKLDRIDQLAQHGVIGGETPTAADLQIGSTIRILLTLGDLRELIEGRPGEHVARRWFADYPGGVPAGAFPAGWVPPRTA